MQQARTQTAMPSGKKTNKKIYMYSTLIAFAALVLLYVWNTIKYKFNERNEHKMGTKFYSWITLGANKTMLTNRAGKFAEGKKNEENNKFLKQYLSDKYAEHTPRTLENYMTLAFPNMDFIFFLRKAFIKSNEVFLGDKDKLTTYLNSGTSPIFFNPHSTVAVEKGIAQALDEAGSRKETFASVMLLSIDLFKNIAQNSEYHFTGLERSEKAKEALESLLDEMSKGEQQPHIQKSVEDNEHIERFLSKKGIDRANVTGSLSEKFFYELTQGSLSPYFSFAYSRFVNMVLMLTLDAEIEIEEKDNAFTPIELVQKRNLQRTLAVGRAIAYAFAKSMSSDLGVEAVKKRGNFLVNFFFTQSLTDVNSKDEENLKRILEKLEERRSFINSTVRP